jgi:hypothetical protein
VPEVLQVIYPQLLNGQLVWDEGGNSKAGVRVSVNLRNQEVEGIWNLTTNNYESSAYEAIQDFSEVIKIAEAGGWRNQGWFANGQAEVALGTPTRQLLKITNYQNGRSEELIVPALVFPVEKSGSNIYYRSAVVVPLIKELLAKDSASGPVRIMAEPAAK